MQERYFLPLSEFEAIERKFGAHKQKPEFKLSFGELIIGVQMALILSGLLWEIFLWQ